MQKNSIVHITLNTIFGFEQSNQNKNILKKWYLNIQAERLKNEEIKFWNNIDSILSISETNKLYIIKQCNTPTHTLSLHIEKRPLKNKRKYSA